MPFYSKWKKCSRVSSFRQYCDMKWRKYLWAAILGVLLWLGTGVPASSSYTPDLSSCPLAAQASLVALSESLTHPSRHWSHLTHSDKRKYYPDICRPLSLSITCHSASQCGYLKRIIIQSEYNGLSEEERQVRETRRIICLKLAGWPPGLWQWQQVYSRLK